MNYIALILNMPWTLAGLILGLISIPRKIKFLFNSDAIVLRVRSFWWYSWLSKAKGIRAMAVGNIVLLGQSILQGDLEHELVHVSQFMREPLIHPFLYEYQNIICGYINGTFAKTIFCL